LDHGIARTLQSERLLPKKEALQRVPPSILRLGSKTFVEKYWNLSEA
jgi:hypothetical protein